MTGISVMSEVSFTTSYPGNITQAAQKSFLGHENIDCTNLKYK